MSNYDFLRNSPLFKDVCLLVLSGSQARGDAAANSDIDIAGCATRTCADIINNIDFQRYVHENPDVFIHSVDNLINISQRCHPNALELLGVEKWQVIYINPIGQLLMDNKYSFLSKYCLLTYKTRITVLLEQLNILTSKDSESTRIKYLSKLFREMYQHSDLLSYHSDDVSVLNFAFKDMRQKNIYTPYITASIKDYPLASFLESFYDLQDLFQQLGLISRNSIQGIDRFFSYKHKECIPKIMSKVLCLYYTLTDIVKNGDLVIYRENEQRFLQEVRGGLFIKENGHIDPEFYHIIEHHENILAECIKNTKLPDEPDYEKTNLLRQQINRMIFGPIYDELIKQ